MQCVKLFHRLDDVSDVDGRQIAVMEALHELGRHALLAVIPDRLTPAMAREIARFPNCDVFQHGVEHVNRGDRLKDEFPVTMSRKMTSQLLADGKDKLEQLLGARVTGYVPPWNYTDPATLDLLAGLGFQYLSAHVRHRFETKLAQINVSVNVLSQYRPV